jgi:hypothetical protein
LNSLLPETETVTVNRYPSRKDDPDEIFVAIADLHIGARTEGLHKTPDFDMDVLERRLDDVAADINKMKAKNINVSILGDIIEHIKHYLIFLIKLII